MFRSVRIQNFRQFKDLELKTLGRINLITGQNNTGKTSLLEALWLHMAGPVDPGVLVRAAELRGISQLGIDGPSSWGWIFQDYKDEAGIVLSGVKVNGKSEALQILKSSAIHAANADRPAAASNLDVQTVSTTEMTAQALQLLFTDTSGVEHKASLEILGSNVLPRAARDVTPRNWYFLSNRHGDPEEEARAFDRLVLAGREDELLDAYRIIDQRVTSVRTLNPGTGQRIYVGMNGGRLLPVDVMGHGFYRMGKIAAAIITAAGGVALIDEIDDGLHYSALQDVWRAVIGLARRHDVQIFATTHSLEAIEAAVEGSEDYEGSLAFYRLERRKDDIEVVMGEDSRLRSAVSVGAELR